MSGSAKHVTKLHYANGVLVFRPGDYTISDKGIITVVLNLHSAPEELDKSYHSYRVHMFRVDEDGAIHTYDGAVKFLAAFITHEHRTKNFLRVRKALSMQQKEKIMELMFINALQSI